ncbi:MAG: signal peptidase I [Spirochaetales bacterium]|nr:MAG: signal peptidase I [Spirochaetales bacterium]
MISSSSSTRLSYKDRRRHQKRRLRLTLLLTLAVLLFLLLSSFVLQPWVLDTSAMEPGYPPGTRFLVLTYAFGGTPERGDVVAVSPPYRPRDSWPAAVFKPVLRFVTFQKAGNGDEPIFKRVIAVPGDVVKMQNSEARVKTASESFFLSEFEVSGREYDIAVPQLPEGWKGPLSGNMDELTLDNDDFFILGDNRGASNDSLYWGAVSSRDIRGRVIFIYWPFKSFGFPR